MGIEKSSVCNEPKINAFMVQEGKRKIQELIKARNNGDDVLQQMNKIMKPTDDRQEY